MILGQFLVKELQDLYESESEQAHLLLKMAQSVTSPALREALRDHAAQTQHHAHRIFQVLELLGESHGGRGEVPAGVQGIITEADRKLRMQTDATMRDYVLISMLQKLEHYEIACYGAARAIAHTLGHDGAAALLQDTLLEEKQIDKQLTHIALTLLKQVGTLEVR
ncbi:MAG: ferritin-like domain-containing protein [Bryobacteraceae bacterium]